MQYFLPCYTVYCCAITITAFACKGQSLKLFSILLSDRKTQYSTKDLLWYHAFQLKIKDYKLGPCFSEYSSKYSTEWVSDSKISESVKPARENRCINCTEACRYILLNICKTQGVIVFILSIFTFRSFLGSKLKCNGRNQLIIQKSSFWNKKITLCCMVSGVLISSFTRKSSSFLVEIFFFSLICYHFLTFFCQRNQKNSVITKKCVLLGRIRKNW